MLGAADDAVAFLGVDDRLVANGLRGHPAHLGLLDGVLGDTGAEVHRGCRSDAIQAEVAHELASALLLLVYKVTEELRLLQAEDLGRPAGALTGVQVGKVRGQIRHEPVDIVPQAGSHATVGRGQFVQGTADLADVDGLDDRVVGLGQVEAVGQYLALGEADAAVVFAGELAGLSVLHPAGGSTVVQEQAVASVHGRVDGPDLVLHPAADCLGLLDGRQLLRAEPAQDLTIDNTGTRNAF